MKTHLVPFHGETITAIETQDGIYVPLLPLCARLGIARQPQQAKLKSDPERWGSTIIVLPSAGGEQETLCIPVNRIAAWLFTLNAKKVKPEAREALLAYQREAADVLDRHFRLRQREQETELVQLRAENIRLREFAFAGHGFANTIRAYQAAGVRRSQLYGYFTGKSKAWLGVMCDFLEEAGMIRLDDWPDAEEYRRACAPWEPEPEQGALDLTPVEGMQHEMARQLGEA